MSQDQTDKLLFEAVKSGSESAFEILFKLYYPVLRRQACAMVADSMVAEELVSDFFLKIWTRRASITIHTTVRGYFYLAVRNASLNYLKSHKIVTIDIQALSLNLESTDEAPLEAIISSEALAEWEQRINMLPAQRQKVFRMNKLEGKRYDEIARDLSLSVNTVRNHVQMALRALSSLCALLLGVF